MQGMIHIYCGDGKGKTTAATGLAVRAAGNDMNVLFARFLKNENSGELKILDGIENIKVLHLNTSYGFYKTLNEADKLLVKQTYAGLWKNIRAEIGQGRYQVLVMDELIAALNHQIISQDELIDFLWHKPKTLEVVITGRNPSDELIKMAHYVSEIKKIKHPFDDNIYARKGIEF